MRLTYAVSHPDAARGRVTEAGVATPGLQFLARPQLRTEPALPQVAPDQLQARVRAEPLVPERDLQVALDPRRETAFSYPHWKWPFVVGVFQASQPENITT